MLKFICLPDIHQTDIFLTGSNTEAAGIVNISNWGHICLKGHYDADLVCKYMEYATGVAVYYGAQKTPVPAVTQCSSFKNVPDCWQSTIFQDLSCDADYGVICSENGMSIVKY